MKTTFVNQKEKNATAPVVARYEELALPLERTTPEYFAYQVGREWISDAIDDMQQRDLLDPLHVRMPFVHAGNLAAVPRGVAEASAGAAIQKRDYIAALEILSPFAKEALQKDGRLCFLAAEAYQGIKKGSIAAKLYMRAIELDGNLADLVYYHLGLLALENGRFNEAVTLFSKLGEIEPAWLQVADYYRGAAYLAMGQNYMGSVALKDSLWHGSEKVLVSAAKDLLDVLAGERKKLWHLDLEVASNSNVFRLAHGKQPPQGMPHRSSPALRLDLDMTHFIFQKDMSSVAVEAGMVFDYYLKQQLDVLDFAVGLAVTMEPLAGALFKVKPFLETIRISGRGVDGFGLELTASFAHWAMQPALKFATAQFFDTSAGSLVLIDPYTGEYTERQMVAARYNALTTFFTPFKSGQEQALLLYPSYAVYRRRDEMSQQDNFIKTAVGGKYTYMWSRDVVLDSAVEMDQREFPQALEGRTDHGVHLKQDAQFRLNGSLHGDVFGEFWQNSSSIADAAYSQNRLGCGIRADF